MDRVWLWELWWGSEGVCELWIVGGGYWVKEEGSESIVGASRGWLRRSGQQNSEIALRT